MDKIDHKKNLETQLTIDVKFEDQKILLQKKIANCHPIGHSCVTCFSIPVLPQHPQVNYPFAKP